MLRTIWDNRWILLALLGLVALNHYGSLNNGFMIDDHLFREGRWAGGYKGYLEFLTRTDSQHYSPLYFAVNYVLFSLCRDWPQLLHILNILLFSANLILFFVLTRLWTRSTPLASLTVLLMAMHPINAFVIGYKTANFVFYCALFQQLSLYFLWQAQQVAVGQRRLIVWSCLCFATALLSNEWALLLPLYAVLMLHTFSGLDLRAAVRLVRPHAIFAILFVMIYLVMAAPRAGLLERFTQLGFSIPEYLASWFHFMLSYATYVILPRTAPFMFEIGLSPHPVWLWGGMALATIGVGALLVRNLKVWPLIAFGCMWFLLGWILVFPAMLGHPTLGLVCEPHWLYFASYGVFLVLASMIVRLSQKFPIMLVAILLATLMVGLLFQTRSFYPVMRTEKDYCLYWSAHSPNNRIALSTLGKIAFREGDHAEALRLYHQLVKAADGEHFRELNNIGLIHHNRKEFAKAAHYLQQAVRVNPNFAPAWNNLGQVARDRGDAWQAFDFFLRAVELDAHLPAARLNLVDSLILGGRPEQAAAIIRPLDIPSLKPFYQHEALTYTCIIALKTADHKMHPACENLVQTLTNAEEYLLLAQRFMDADLHKNAQGLLNKALDRYPDVKEIYLLLGTSLGNHENWNAAISVWEKGRNKFPAEPLFSSYIVEAQKLKASTSR